MHKNLQYKQVVYTLRYILKLIFNIFSLILARIWCSPFPDHKYLVNKCIEATELLKIRELGRLSHFLFHELSTAEVYSSHQLKEKA